MGSHTAGEDLKKLRRWKLQVQKWKCGNGNGSGGTHVKGSQTEGTAIMTFFPWVTTITRGE